MDDNDPHEAARSSAEARSALGRIRDALEDVLPPGWLRPADETPSSVAAEVDALVTAIRAMAAAIPPDRLTEKLV